MSFERRVTVAAAAAVAVAVLLAAGASYVAVRQELEHSINKSLTRTLAGVESLRPERPIGALEFGAHPSRLGAPGVLELVGAKGVITPARGVARTQTLPASPAVRALARTGKGRLSFDTRIDGTDVRVLAAGLKPGVAVEIDRSLSEIESTLSHLRLILVIVAAIGIALAALLGAFVARTTLAPVRRLTAAAQHVAATNDLGQRIDDARRDELGSLARSFNAMLAALEGTIRALDESARAQRQLVADASHELRTPVTSLRTNIEILQRSSEIAPDERDRLIADVVEQLEELSTLVGDLIDLARDDEQIEPLEEVRLDILVGEAIERAQLHAPRARFEVELEETVVSAVPSRLDRAVNNLLDNAVKFAGTAEPIEVRLHDGELAIRDHGPGIDPDELPHIFDRFFRGSRSRSLPGSGLGLAIVRQVAERHSGTVTAGPAPGGGTIVRLQVPLATTPL